MNQETSHIQQWEQLKGQSHSFGLAVTYDAEFFYLHSFASQEEGARMEARCHTLADLRAAISDNVAARRAAGERI